MVAALSEHVRLVERIVHGRAAGWVDLARRLPEAVGIRGGVHADVAREFAEVRLVVLLAGIAQQIGHGAHRDLPRMAREEAVRRPLALGCGNTAGAFGITDHRLEINAAASVGLDGAVGPVAADGVAPDRRQLLLPVDDNYFCRSAPS